MANGFNRLAPFYDALACLVFGKNIRESQLYFLRKIVARRRALAVGGGTGAFLKTLHMHHPDAETDFVEKSSFMIKRAKSKAAVTQKVNFIAVDFNSFKTTEKYDLILLPFFLDMFSNERVGAIAKSVSTFAGQGASIIVSDFIRQEKSGWKRGLLKVMYRFFRLTCGIEATQLPDWQRIFEAEGWNIQECKTYFSGMIGAYLLSRPQ